MVIRVPIDGRRAMVLSMLCQRPGRAWVMRPVGGRLGQHIPLAKKGTVCWYVEVSAKVTRVEYRVGVPRYLRKVIARVDVRESNRGRRARASSKGHMQYATIRVPADGVWSGSRLRSLEQGSGIGLRLGLCARM